MEKSSVSSHRLTKSTPMIPTYKSDTRRSSLTTSEAYIPPLEFPNRGGGWEGAGFLSYPSGNTSIPLRSVKRAGRIHVVAIPLRGHGKIRNERHCGRRQRERAYVRTCVRACVVSAALSRARSGYGSTRRCTGYRGDPTWNALT